MAQPLAPLTTENLEQLDQALQDLTEAREIMARAKSAGIDVGPFEERVNGLESRLLRIKQAFSVGG